MILLYCAKLDLNKKIIKNPLKYIPRHTWKAVFLHWGIMFLIAASIILYFFKVYLPAETKHGEEFTVPDLENLSIDLAKEHLQKLGLRDSVYKKEYSRRHKLNAVISQNPTPGSKVKKNRLVYLVINTNEKPVVTITEKLLKKFTLVSNADAIHTLKSLGFQVEPKYVKRPNKGYVYECKVNGKAIKVGDKLEIHTMVTIYIGQGTSSDDKFHDTEQYH